MSNERSIKDTVGSNELPDLRPESELQELKKQLIALMRRGYSSTRPIVDFIKDRAIPVDIMDSPEVEHAKGLLITHMSKSGVTIVGEIFPIAKYLRISKRLQQDPAIKKWIKEQVISYFIPGVKADRERILQRLQNFFELADLLSLDVDESWKYVRDMIQGCLRTGERFDFDNVQDISHFFNVSADELREIFAERFAQAIFSTRLAGIVVGAANELGCEVREFAEPCKRAMLRAIELGYTAYVISDKDRVGITDEECGLLIGQAIDTNGADKIIAVLDEIPPSILRHLEERYLLQSYVISMNVPLINIHDPSVYRRYLQARASGKPEAVQQLIAAITDRKRRGEVGKLTIAIAQARLDEKNSAPKARERVIHENLGKTDDRRYIELDQPVLLGRLLGEGRTSLTEALDKIAEPGERIAILDLGAGIGATLSGLASAVQKMGRKTHTTAIEIDEDRLEQLGRRKLDLVVDELAEDFVPDRQYHLIYDLYSATSYAQANLRKNLILKYGYALKKGGIMIVRFDFLESENAEIKKEFPHVIQQSLSENGRKKMSFQTQVKDIERTLAKRGFKAVFSINDASAPGGYHVSLAIQRLR